MAEAPRDQAALRRARWKLVGLGAFFLLPFVAGTLVWWLDLAPGAAGNYGTLLPPRPVKLPQDGTLKGKWLLVQFDGGACSERCERKLYFMRQVRKAMGREVGRVERLWIITDDVTPRPEVMQAIEGTVTAPLSSFPDAALFSAERGGDHADHLYVVDPLGNLMMRFPREPEPSRVIKDLQRLLRVSRFG
jgi:hypothetical protein